MPKFSETYRYGKLRLGKRLESGVWVATFNHPDKGRTQQSLGTTIKRDAERVADKWSAQLTNNQFSIADGSLPLKTLYTKFFEAKEGRRSEKAVARIRSSVRMFSEWLENTRPNVRLIKHLSKEMVREFQVYRLSHGLSERTIDNDIMNLHTVFLWGNREGHVVKSPFNYSKSGPIDLFDLPSEKREVYSPSEYEQLVSEAGKQKYWVVRDLIIIFANTGLRFGEAANMTKEWIYWDAEIPYIEIRNQGYWKPKNAKQIRYVPLNEDVQKLLKGLCENSTSGQPLLRNRFGRKVAGNHTLLRLKRLFPRIGITPDRRLYWHSWRNYFIVDCFRNGVNINDIMNWVGHDDEKMVLHYANVKARNTDGFREFHKMMR